MNQTTKHTPAPWKVYKAGTHSKYSAHIIPVAGPAIAHLKEGRNDIQEANANLMAAAPELLQTLESLVSQYDKEACSIQDYRDLLEKAAAVAKKARGK